MIFEIIKQFRDYYSSPDRKNDKPMSHEEYCEKLIHVLDVVENLIMKEEFAIEGQYVDGEMTGDVEDPFILKELDEFIIVQPLTILCQDELEALHEAVKKISSDSVGDKHILILPFDIKLIRAKIKRRVVDNGTTSDVGECNEDSQKEMS